MKIPSSISLMQSRISALLAGLALFIGVMGMSGWIFDSLLLRKFFSIGATMKVNTALLIIGSGTCLLLMNKGKIRAAQILLSVIILYSLLILAEHLGRSPFNVDEWLFRDLDTNPLLEFPGRTSVMTVVSIIIIAVMAWLVMFQQYYLSQLLGAGLFLMLYATMLGHIFGATVLYRQGHYSGIALHTAISLLLLDLAVIFYQARKGWMQRFVLLPGGRKGLLYLFGYFLCIAPLLIVLNLYLILPGKINPVMGIILLAISSGLMVIPLAYRIINRINRMDTDLQKAHQRLGIALEAGDLGSYDINLDTGEMVCTRQFKANFGLEQDAKFNFPDLLDSILPDYRSGVEQKIHAAVLERTPYQAEYQIRWPDTSVHWISASGAALYDLDGKTTRITGVVLNITNQKEVTAQKDAFISVVSHELKTPLTSLKAYMRILNARAKTKHDEDEKSILGKADFQINKINNMINGFLNVSMLEEGKLPMIKRYFQLQHLVKEVLDEFWLTHSDRIIQFQIRQDVPVVADREKISEVLNNLLNNAIKYSPTESVIQVTCTIVQNKAEVSIRDEGIGIDHSEIPKLFKRFYRIESYASPYIPGFGIGLYLSAEIINRHGGEIWVHSEKGGGSTFFFSLNL